MEPVDIKVKYNELNSELKHALAVMERTERVFKIRDQIKDLQNMCPHNNGHYDFSTSTECPYCGKKFKE